MLAWQILARCPLPCTNISLPIAFPPMSLWNSQSIFTKCGYVYMMIYTNECLLWRWSMENCIPDTHINNVTEDHHNGEDRKIPAWAVQALTITHILLKLMWKLIVLRPNYKRLLLFKFALHENLRRLCALKIYLDIIMAGAEMFCRTAWNDG